MKAIWTMACVSTSLRAFGDALHAYQAANYGWLMFSGIACLGFIVGAVYAVRAEGEWF